MNCNDVIEYSLEKTGLFTENAILSSKEIGDGNLNYIFRVEDVKNDRSIIIKQAGERSRLNPSGPLLSKDRNRLEGELLSLYSIWVRNQAPIVYFIDKVMHCLVMEDLREFKLLRSELMKGKRFKYLVDQITDFLVFTSISTIDVIMDPILKKEMVRKFINPKMCEITERLVFTQPYTNSLRRNKINPLLEEWVRKFIYQDTSLKIEVMKLKYRFMNEPQALIHGDLHTGSILVTENCMKVFDPEFAFFGPIGYDVGNILANLIFIVSRFDTLDKTGYNKFINMTIQDIANIIDTFKQKFKSEMIHRSIDELMRDEVIIDWYLDNILADTAGMCGTELIRRAIGYAKVMDIESIEDINARAKAEKVVITLGKQLILDRFNITSGKDYLNILESHFNNY